MWPVFLYNCVFLYLFISKQSRIFTAQSSLLISFLLDGTLFCKQEVHKKKKDSPLIEWVLLWGAVFSLG